MLIRLFSPSDQKAKTVPVSGSPVDWNRLFAFKAASPASDAKSPVMAAIIRWPIAFASAESCCKENQEFQRKADSNSTCRSGSEDLQTIRIHFARSAARYVQESTWHESQQLFPQPDGTLIAEFQLPDIEEIQKWILSFGSSATALEPPALVERISEEVQQMLKTYARESK